jgi:hypothetical protein
VRIQDFVSTTEPPEPCLPETSSLSRISERTLRHLIQYSNLITPQFRAQLLAQHVQFAQMRQMLSNPPAPPTGPHGGGLALSEFSKLLTGELKLNVPVYTVWGACEDVAILEKIRAAPAAPIAVPNSPASVHSSPEQHAPSYSIPNLTVLSEATTRVLVIGGVRLRLFGLGGAVVPHKLFDNGEGQATIAGAAGTMWTTVLQIGELVDTAQRVSLLSCFCHCDLSDPPHPGGTTRFTIRPRHDY